ncbi:MAG: alpha/beta fold hydrolase [Bacteroidota bacterium]
MSFFPFVLLLLFLLLFMIVVSLVLLVIGPVMLLQPHRRTADYYRRAGSPLHPRDAGLPSEELTLTTAEGIPLSCWLISRPDARGTVIYLHGVSECKIVGLPVAALLYRRGYNVFLYDARRHGDSGGSYCTYGFYERHDAGRVMDYLSAREDFPLGRIGLFGSSMGAAVALQVAACDARVAAVIAESGFATLHTIFDDYQKRVIRLPWHYLRNIVIRRSEYIAHFKAAAVSPLAAVEKITVPLFILHGTADTLIRPEYSAQVYARARPPKELWLIPGARHDNIAQVGGTEYAERVAAFFDAHLPGGGTQRPNQ